MRSVNTEVHLTMKVAPGWAKLNDLAARGRELGFAMARTVLAQVLWERQEQELDRVHAGLQDLACPGCGVVHCGPGSVLRRGVRRRRLQTSCGRVVFALRQVSCGACRKTFCPFGPLLGLRPRQRIAEELLEQLGEGVLDLSYRTTCALGRAWLGGSVGPRTLWNAVQDRGRRVRFTARGPLDVFLVDGTRVRAGRRPHGEAAVLGLQIDGRDGPPGRFRVRKRLLGFGVGRSAWPAVLGVGHHAPLVVTDAASGLRELVQAICPTARHQLCEWHLTESLKHFLTLQRVRPVERRALARELAGILRRRSRRGYTAFRAKLRRYRNVASLLRQALPYIMYADRSAERTNSIAEREMRELNRRTDVGVRWSIAGVRNLLGLRLARRHNPDDYARVWERPTPVSWQLVPQPG